MVGLAGAVVSVLFVKGEETTPRTSAVKLHHPLLGKKTGEGEGNPLAENCQLWWADREDAHDSLLALLSAEERRRWESFCRQEDRERAVVSYGLVRLVLAKLLGGRPGEMPILRTCFQCGKPHGKPFLAPSHGGGWQFSVSHSGNRVVMAVAKGTPLGVDVEENRPDLAIDLLAEEALTPSEAESLTQYPVADRTEAFLAMWTRKEAVLKSTGQGLSIPLKSFCVSGPGESPRLIDGLGLPLSQRLSMVDLDPGPGYTGSLAVIGPCEGLEEHDGSALIQAWREK